MNQLLLLVFLVLFGGLFDVACAVFLLESLYSPGSIDIFLLARIKRMAHRADLCVDFLCRAAGLESVAAAATNHHLIVFWMYPFFHNYNPLKYLKTMNSNNINVYFNRNFLQYCFYRFGSGVFIYLLLDRSKMRKSPHFH